MRDIGKGPKSTGSTNVLSGALAAAAKKRVALTAKRDKTEANGNPASAALTKQRADVQAYFNALNANQSNVNNNNGGGSNNYSGGGGSSGLAAAPAADPSALTPNQQTLADQLRGQITTASTGNQTAYEEAKAKIAAQYKAAEQDRSAVYAKEQADIQGNLANLGMDFSSSDMAKDWNKDNRYLQESADTALATDQAWFDKMKTTNADLYNSLLTELAQQELALGAANAAAASGGGGGGGGGGGFRRRGGGGSSSGGVSQTDTSTLTEDELFYNPVLMEAIANEPNPYKREILYAQLDLGGGQVNSALKNIETARVAANNTKSNPYVGKTRVLNTIGNIFDTANKTGTLSDLNFAQQFFRQYSPNYGPIVTKQSGKAVSKQSVKSKVPGFTQTPGYKAPARMTPAPASKPKAKTVYPKYTPKKTTAKKTTTSKRKNPPR